MNEGISPQLRGYTHNPADTQGTAGYGRPSDADLNNRMSEPREEEAVACAKCGQLPNDVLILTCDHNLCLKCASANLKAQNEKSNNGAKNGETVGQNSFQTVICELCHIATVLDPGSATELLTMNHGPESAGNTLNETQNAAGRQGNDIISEK